MYTDPPPPPENVRLSQVDRNRLDFTWDPVQTTCPVVEYKVTAVNCGVCPTAIHNTSITRVVDDVTTVIDNLCILSIQSVVCGVTAENRSNFTTPFRGIYTLPLLLADKMYNSFILIFITVPGAPKLTSILPCYDSTSRKLKKIDIQINMTVCE